MATKVLTLRIEGELHKLVCQFQNLHGLESVHDAYRALLELSLSKGAPNFTESAVLHAAWRAGVKGSAAKLRDEVEKAVARALPIPEAG